MRETKTIETPFSKDKIELLAYITGGDKRMLSNVLIDGGLNVDPVTQETKGVTSELINKAQDQAIKTVIVSINGLSDGANIEGSQPFSVVQKVLDMRNEDFEFVISEINKVTGDDKFNQKKTI